jgi:uncharacterized protein (UPF0276 family)
VTARVPDQPSPFDRCRAVPVLGVGLGVDIFDDQPDYRKLIKKFPDAFDFLEMYSRGDWEHTDHLAKTVPPWVRRTYHHEGLDPTGPALCPDDTIEGCKKNMLLLDAPWSVEELAVRHIDGKYTDFFFPAVLTRDSLECTVANLNELQSRLPRPILPENAPYEFAVGDMHLFDFVTEVSHRTHMGMVLDLGHVFSYQLCVGKADNPTHGIEKLDLSRVIEVHLAGARFDPFPGGPAVYRDLHGAGPIPEVSKHLLREWLPRMENVRAITVEVETATESAAAAQVAEVKAVVREIRPDFLKQADANRRPRS